jgi:membrane-bound ClpP family serine protease
MKYLGERKLYSIHLSFEYLNNMQLSKIFNNFMKAIITINLSMIVFNISILILLLDISTKSCRNVSLLLCGLSVILLFIGIKYKSSTFARYYLVSVFFVVLSNFSPIDICVRSDTSIHINVIPVILENGKKNYTNQNENNIQKFNVDYVLYRSHCSIDAPKYTIVFFLPL